MYYLIIAVLIAADQFTKYLIQSGVALNESIPVVDGIFHITYIQNFGAAFSILQNRQTLLLIISGAAIAALLGYLILKGKTLHRMAGLSFAFIIAGGVGNLIDRLTKGYVVDFFDFRVWPIFNVADIAVCCGCALLIFYVLFWERHVERRSEERERKGD
ncbi:signal peptidase II [Bacilliculturomica massiliensis]|uniref:signal peptidase II n=1 Tax=Bacilliculturomica massiliensis TaxID=1917867 RepID=UPI001030F260|nr:signal peptidase II [Bacilliculturomica massiliensis]